jgi:peroxiredoxin
VLHQLFRIDPEKRELLQNPCSKVFDTDIGASPEDVAQTGWSTAVQLVGSSSDVMFLHFRPTLDEIGVAQRAVAREPWFRALIPTYSFLSVTEAGLYYLTSQLVRGALERGGKVGDEAYLAEAKARIEQEAQNPHTKRRLYPQRPAHMPYVCFYPMSKRRAPQQNWYALSLEERNRLMYAHGMTGRKYAGRVMQVIAGSIGFESWEWGVTLFAADPLEFKRIVTEMRFDEVSAQYGEFGDFFVGKMKTLREALTA